MKQRLGVGIIGASAERGWAKLAHVPAIQQLAGLELAAVASGTQAKADAAVKALGAKTGYSDGKDLVQDPNVDIVAVAVKVPDHRELVLAALAAGKHIYCEWPLGRNLAETEEMAQAALQAKVHVAIGLQTRVNRMLLRARELVASGAVGRLLSTRVLSTTVAFGPQVEAAMAFAEDEENGATLVTIHDLWARELMKRCDTHLFNDRAQARPQWNTIMGTKRFQFHFTLGRELAQTLDETPLLTGLNPEDYEQWRSENKLVDNMSNRFRYASSVAGAGGRS